MSQENVELVRVAYAAFNRRDFDAIGEVLHPDLEWHPYLGAVEGSIYRGRNAVLEMWSDLDDSFGGTLRVELLEVIDCGEQVVAVIEGRGTGSGSGADVRQRWAQVATIRDGAVFRVRAYPDRASALEAAGLSGTKGAQDD
jgi:ketosteroid isomerase-like protein